MQMVGSMEETRFSAPADEDVRPSIEDGDHYTQLLSEEDPDSKFDPAIPDIWNARLDDTLNSVRSAYFIARDEHSVRPSIPRHLGHACSKLKALKNSFSLVRKDLEQRQQSVHAERKLLAAYWEHNNNVRDAIIICLREFGEPRDPSCELENTADAESFCRIVRERFRDLHTNNDKLQGTNSVLLKDLCDCQMEVKRLSRENENLNTRIKSLQEETHSQSERIAEVERERDMALEENKSLTKQNAELSASRLETQGQLSKSMDDLSKERENVTKERDNIVVERDNRARDRDEHIRERGRLEKTIGDLQAREEASRRDFNLQIEVERKERDAVSKENVSLVAANEGLKKELESLTRDHSNQVETPRQELDVVKESLAHKETDNVRLSEEIKSSKEARTNLEKECDDLRGKLDAEQLDAASARKQAADEHAEALAEQRAETEAARKAYEEATATVEELQLQLERLKATCEASTCSRPECLENPPALVRLAPMAGVPENSVDARLTPITDIYLPSNSDPVLLTPESSREAQLGSDFTGDSDNYPHRVPTRQSPSSWQPEPSPAVAGYSNNHAPPLPSPWSTTPVQQGPNVAGYVNNYAAPPPTPWSSTSFQQRPDVAGNINYAAPPPSPRSMTPVQQGPNVAGYVNNYAAPQSTPWSSTPFQQRPDVAGNINYAAPPLTPWSSTTFQPRPNVAGNINKNAYTPPTPLSSGPFLAEPSPAYNMNNNYTPIAQSPRLQYPPLPLPAIASNMNNSHAAVPPSPQSSGPVLPEPDIPDDINNHTGLGSPNLEPCNRWQKRVLPADNANDEPAATTEPRKRRRTSTATGPPKSRVPDPMSRVPVLKSRVPAPQRRDESEADEDYDDSFYHLEARIYERRV